MHTLKDVAVKAGVSVTTVSRILNNRGYIDDKTRKKVFGAMTELDYHANELARSLSKKRANIIGVIVPSLLHPYFCEVAYYLEQYASLAGYTVMICNANHQKNKEHEYINMLKSNKVSGIVLSSRTENVEKILPENLPVLTFERVISNRISSVSCDNYSGGEMAARHLLEVGCKNLLHFSGVQNIKMAADARRDSFEEVCKENQVPYNVYNTEEIQFQTLNYEAYLEQTILANPETDGIFAGSDVIAAEIISVCKKNSIRIPEDMKLIGFDDIRLASLTTPKITTIHQPIEEMCACSIDTLFHQIHDGYLPSQVILPVSLVIRESTKNQYGSECPVICK